MEQIREARRVKLIQTNLELAQQALDANNLEDVENSFEEALHVEGEHPERASTIRQMLKEYSDQIITKANPDWDRAHDVLEILVRLELQNEQTLAWQRKLDLNEAQFLLEHGNLDKSFIIFHNLMTDAEGSDIQDKLQVDISDIVRDQVAQRLPQHEWPFVHQMIERLKSLPFPSGELYNWLETISQILITAAEQERARHRYQNWVRALVVVIIVFLAVAYLLVFIIN